MVPITALPCFRGAADLGAAGPRLASGKSELSHAEGAEASRLAEAAAERKKSNLSGKKRLIGAGLSVDSRRKGMLLISAACLPRAEWLPERVKTRSWVPNAASLRDHDQPSAVELPAGSGVRHR
jgi:hypothetical protein